MYSVDNIFNKMIDSINIVKLCYVDSIIKKTIIDEITKD